MSVEGDMRSRRPGPREAGLRDSVVFGLLVTAAALGAVELFSLLVIRLPTLTVLLVAVAFVSFMRGMPAGLASAFAASLYGLYYFDSPGPLLSYSEENSIRLAILVITATAVAAMMGVLRARMQASEAALRHQLDVSSAVNNSLGEAVFALDTRRRVTFVNPAAARLLQRSPTELIGLPIDEVVTFSREDGTSLAAFGRYDDLVPGRPIRTGEYTMHLPNGGTMPVAGSSAPILDDGRMAGTVIAFHNISKRRHAEEQLRQQFAVAERARSETRAVLDAVDEAIILVGADGRFLSVNRRFSELFGVAADTVLGRTFGELQPLVDGLLSDGDALREQLAVASQDTSRLYTMAVTQRSPVTRELQLFSAPVYDVAGSYLGRLYVLRDVTREREVDRLKSEFVALVSHELRTPLTSIKGYVDLVLDEEAGPVPAEQREFLEIVKANAGRLVKLINDLLDVSRIEAGKMQLSLAPVQVGPIVQSAVTALRLQIAAAQQQLAVDIPPGLPAVMGDPDRLGQVVTNFLSNAHKYTPAGGSIVISARREGGFVHVAVRDSGVGMSPAEQQQLFNKFFRAQNRATREAAGTGLGLSIARALVEMHQGAIEVVSAPGDGSTFSFSVPVAQDAARAAPVSAGLRNGGLILVVDDEEAIAGLISRYLERAGYEVLIAHNAHDALALARREQPDLICLDILLPDVDGLTLLEWLKSEPDTVAIPVLLLSSMDDTGRGTLLGAVDYLRKPVDAAMLLDRVGHLLQANSPEPAGVVLVAEDDADVRGLICEQLRGAGYQVVAAEDGAQAVELVVQGLRPSLALLDMRMPRLDGLGTLRALRADPATRDLPIIIMTASPAALETDRSAIEAFGATLLMRRPRTIEDLAVVIAQAGAARETGK